ncbi:MAG TPA: hypothetical protein VF800_11735 [Telluria sp.]|jgi:hypothetical protein
MSEDDELQAQAVALVKQYGFFLPKPAKMFFGKLADFLNWYKLKEVL